MTKKLGMARQTACPRVVRQGESLSRCSVSNKRPERESKRTGGVSHSLARCTLREVYRRETRLSLTVLSLPNRALAVGIRDRSHFSPYHRLRDGHVFDVGRRKWSYTFPAVHKGRVKEFNKVDIELTSATLMHSPRPRGRRLRRLIRERTWSVVDL